MGTNRIRAVAGAGLLALAALLAWQWQRPAEVVLRDQWTQVLDEAFDTGTIKHKEAWDELLKPDEDGGLSVRAWLHAKRQGQPRGPFILTAKFRPVPSPALRWLELVAASPVEYYTDDLNGGNVPRSRYAGVFGRVELGEGYATLSVGQRNLDGAGKRVLARRVAMDTAGELPPMELSLLEDRLQLRFGAADISTLADHVPPGVSPEMRFGLRGERCKVLHLSAKTLSPTAEDVALREVETYLGANRHDLILPALVEMAALSPTPRLQVRLARAYEQIGQPEKAAAIWPSLTDTAKTGFYAGYARLELLKAQAREQGASMDLDAELARLAGSLGGHPVVPQVQLWRARMLAAGGTGRATAQAQAVAAMNGGDPEVSAAALDLLSGPSMGLSPGELLALLDEQAAGPTPAFLAELLAVEQAQLNRQLGDLKGLAGNARSSRLLGYGTRKRVYGILAEALAEAIQASKLKETDTAGLQKLLGEAAFDAAWVLDYLYVRSFPQVRPAWAKQAHDRTLLAILQGFTRIPKAAKRSVAAFYDPAVAKASAYGQLQQGPLSEDAAQGLCLDFVSGSYWGAGIALPGKVSDLSGVRSLQAKVLAPKGALYYFTLSESGVGSPTAPGFAGKDGADGEQYLLAPQTGSGEWQDIRLPLSAATVSITWGNPDGNHVLDLQAIEKVDLALPGGQGEGRLCLKDLRFGSGP